MNLLYALKEVLIWRINFVIVIVIVIGYHVYVDDTQIYISFNCKHPLEAISKLNSCPADIRRWIITNKLKMNDSKTEFIVFKSPQQKCGLSGLSVNVGESMITQSSNVRDLGVIFDQSLNVDDHRFTSTSFQFSCTLYHTLFIQF